jgi:hypothetical protein
LLKEESLVSPPCGYGFDSPELCRGNLWPQILQRTNDFSFQAPNTTLQT